MLEQHLVILLMKLCVAASLASLLVRIPAFQQMLMAEERTLVQRVKLALGFSSLFGAGVAARVLTRDGYLALDLGFEGSLLCGITGGYVSGLISGVLISIPAMIDGEWLTMPMFAGVGVLGALLRDLAPEPEEIWRFSPFFDLNLYRLLRKWKDPRRPGYHLFFLMLILFAEFLRMSASKIFPFKSFFSVYGAWGNLQPATVLAIYGSTLFAVTVPLKIWNATRTERKLESQQALLTAARLKALTSQINPHFLFNTLNSVSSLIRLNPEEARVMVHKLSRIMRRLLRQQDNLTPLRDELAFIDDYLSIEMVRFDKLHFSKEVDPQTLDLLVPSMILQPLIENSIKHGLGAKVEGGTIRLRTLLADGRLRLLVEDDGVGIPESRLATLFEQGIGVSNVNERLKVIYGKQYRMSIDSKPGEGTRTEIDLPHLSGSLAAVS